MNEQNPFNFEQETAATKALPAQGSGAQALSAAQVAGIPVLHYQQRPTIRSREFSELEDFNVAARQDPFSNQIAQNVVLFPKAQHVQVNEEGVFIPTRLFGRDAQAKFRQEHRPDGRIQVIVYGAMRGERANIRRREEALDRSLELQWLSEHEGQYADLWVALEGDRLLASGENGREVFLAARAQGAARPFLMHVQPEGELPFGGW